MQFYQAIIQGTGIKLSFNSEIVTGFFTTQRVKGNSEAEARSIAIQQVRERFDSKFGTADALGSPEIVVDKIRKVSWLEYLSCPNKGFTFFAK